MLERLLAMRHPDSDLPTVRLVWKVVIPGLIFIWVLMPTTAFLLIWPSLDVGFWGVALVSPAVGTTLALLSLVFLGAFGQPPRGMYAESAANARRIAAEADASDRHTD